MLTVKANQLREPGHCFGSKGGSKKRRDTLVKRLARVRAAVEEINASQNHRRETKQIRKRKRTQ